MEFSEFIWMMIYLFTIRNHHQKVVGLPIHSKWKGILEKDFEVTIPVLTNQNGEFVTHDLNTLFHHKQKSRVKRSAVDTLHLHVNTSKHNFHLQLQPNYEILAGHFKVYRRGTVITNGVKSRNTTSDEQYLGDICFYRGSIKNFENSSVAVSLCDGMMGYIHTGDEHYIIEPLPVELHQIVHRIKGSNSNHSDHTSSNTRLVNSFVESHLISGVRNHIIYNYKASRRRTDEKDMPCGHDFLDSQSHTKDRQNPFLYAEDINSASSQEFHPHQRIKRSLSSRSIKGQGHGEDGERRSVETIVVVDHDMLITHGESNVTTYVLTLMNMVNNLFHDNTIGTKINISLVALILLEGEEPGLVVENQADQALNNFCYWQSNLKGLHHDHAILLTGVDICSANGQFCDTLGFAPIEGMCKRYRSCTVNEDIGLGTAFTITHEAGHNFGMKHDGDDNYCTDYSGSIMAPRLRGTSGIFKWSACSRKYLDRFLSSQKSWCLQNAPRHISSLQFPDSLPGELYDADTQCKWQFGPRAKLCTYSFALDVCRALWCYTGGYKCETKFLPAAEGTSCGHARWCRKGMCVSYGDNGPDATDGQWSAWSVWSDCSQSCGRGVMFRQRSCNSPRPQYGGRDCSGDSRSYRLCNLQTCPHRPGVAPLTPRARQCAVYNHRAFRGLPYQWIPYTYIYEAEDQCRLYCKAVEKSFYFEMSHKVDDGTECLLDPDGVCINGECQTVGCDLFVGSTKKVDICGICGGDNTTCTVVSGNITQHFKQNTYNYLLTLPKGARSISIRELTISSSYFAIKSTSGTYYLNGNWQISWPSKQIIANTEFVYTRTYNKPEKLTANGPTNRDLIIEVLSLKQSPAVHFQYTLPKSIDEIRGPVDTYTWSVSKSRCSASCATGEKVITARCFQNHKVEVDLKYCNISKKPYTGVVPCNQQPCPPRWISEDWSTCTRSCSGGTQRRRVMCLQTLSSNETRQVGSHRCAEDRKPIRRQDCNVQECPPEWRTGHWTQCSATCGKGRKRRLVVCKNRYQRLPSHYCSENDKPKSTDWCETRRCYTDLQWYLSPWSKCSVTCGSGMRTRSMRCSGRSPDGQVTVRPAEECQQLDQPLLPLQQVCEDRSCDLTTKWFSSPWTQCSSSCGQGRQMRLVRCMDNVTGKVQSGCNQDLRPPAVRVCQSTRTCGRQDDCTDAWGICNLVPLHGLCPHHYYGKQCCKSCHKHNTTHNSHTPHRN